MPVVFLMPVPVAVPCLLCHVVELPQCSGIKALPVVYLFVCMLELTWMLPGSLLRYHIKFKAAFAISVCCTAVAVRAFLSVVSLLDIYRLKALLNQHSMLVQVLILNKREGDVHGLTRWCHCDSISNTSIKI